MQISQQISILNYQLVCNHFCILKQNWNYVISFPKHITIWECDKHRKIGWTLNEKEKVHSIFYKLI